LLNKFSKSSSSNNFTRTGPRFESTPRSQPKSVSISAPVESTLVGAPTGRILTDAQLMRDTLFAMEAVPGDFWSFWIFWSFFVLIFLKFFLYLFFFTFFCTYFFNFFFELMFWTFLLNLFFEPLFWTFLLNFWWTYFIHFALIFLNFVFEVLFWSFFEVFFKFLLRFL